MARLGRHSGVALALLWLGLAGQPAFAQESVRGDAPTPDTAGDLGGALQTAFEPERRETGVFPGLTAAIQKLPPFLRDTRLWFNARTFYWDHWRSDKTRGTAWALGGGLQYRSGWVFDVARIGAAVYTSQPLVAPKNSGGTGLLRPGQEGYTVAGEAFLELRYGENQNLTLFRQIVDLPYVNRADTRMTPNTFEGYLIRASLKEQRFLGDMNYVIGWIDKIRPRDEEDFVKMSEVAGVPGGDDGMATVTLRWEPWDNLYWGVTNHFVPDTYNTFYGEGSWTYKLTDDWEVRLDGQLTWQRSVGKARSDAGRFDTTMGSLRLAASWEGAIFTLAASGTSEKGRIQNPWGLSPSYLGLMLSDFDLAGQGAILFGVSYDFGKRGIPGLSAFTNIANGIDVGEVPGAQGNPIAEEIEVDLTVDYRFQTGWLKGLWLRTRGAWRSVEGAPRDDYQLRVILNYEIQIL